MKTHSKLFSLFLVLCLILSAGAAAYAAAGGYTMTYRPGTTDTVTNLPDPNAGTGGEAYTVSSQIPEREGYEFLGWTLDYGRPYVVTYVVNPDPTYGSPVDSTVPKDPKQYALNETVNVVDQLTTEVDYAFNNKGEKVKGTWKFETWDKKDDFEITEDTTITGSWIFTPAPAKVYNYTVEYWLVDGSKLVTKVADDKPGKVDALGEEVTEEAIPMGSKLLKAKYRLPQKYRIKPHWEKVTATITKDNQVIYIFYELIPHGQ